MFHEYRYLSTEHLHGFNSYKYSAIDTSPLSNYVMHPFWNFCVKFIPESVAPNLITFVGFLFLLTDVLVLLVLDFDSDAASGPVFRIPNWLYFVCGLNLFINYNLDGIDGKQARKIGVSGPLGELFDHGLDSYVVFFIPFCLFSIFGRDEYSVSPFRGYLMVLSVILNFYVSHWEKYNTGTLYLPWGYDLSMWACSLMFIVAGLFSPSIFKLYIWEGVNFVQVLEVVVHMTGLFTTLPIAVYNVYLSYTSGNNLKYPFSEAIRPIWTILVVSSLMTTWALVSPNHILDVHLKPFLLLLGTIFSNISCRLIVAEMSHQRCEVVNWMTWPLAAGILMSIYHPHLEVYSLYVMLAWFLLMHVHYGCCVVKQICRHFKINCFTVPKVKGK